MASSVHTTSMLTASSALVERVITKKMHVFVPSRCFFLLLFLSFAASGSIEAQEPSARAAVKVLPQDSSGGTDDFYTVDLANGSLQHIDRLRRDPLRVRARRLRQNLFQDIGRPIAQSAGVGEIFLEPIRSSDMTVRAALFVETSTGYAAYFDQLGKNDVFGRIVTLIGRPFASLAAADGKFALLMRHDSNGRAEGAYLYHSASGRAAFLGGIAKLDPDVTAKAVSGFPTLTGHAAVVELQVSERTTGYLVADTSEGSLRFLDLNDSGRLSARDNAASLFPTFSPQATHPVSVRFIAAPVRNDNETTTHVLFVDVATGSLAVLGGIDDTESQPTFTPLAANLYGTIGTSPTAGQRAVAAVAGRDADGETAGIWLVDSLTRAIVFVEGIETPSSATVRRVAIDN